MSRGTERSGRMRSMGKALAIVALLSIPVAFGGCRALEGLLGGGRSPTPTEQRPAPQAAQQPTPVQPTATPQPAVAPQRAVSQEQAQAVVRAWFEALAAGDYQRAEQLTTGGATRQTRQTADAIQRETGQRGVQVSLSIQRLNLTPAPQPPAGQAVHADFTIDANAQAGPFSIPARTLEGGANFVVESTDAGPKITEIRDVSGLPMG
ncbi:MAG: hypothetical protein ACYC3V_20520 [Chloroflexota bacterium]